MILNPIRSPIRSPLRKLGALSTNVLPKSGLLINSKAYDAALSLFTDRVGASTRTIQPLQYMDCDGTGYFASAEIVGTETVTSSEGTSTASIAAGRLNATAGTLWSVVLSNGSRYEFATRVSTVSAMLYDVSGNGRHLTATGFADLDVLCGSGMDEGSDWLNQQGYSAAPLGLFFDNDPSQYIEIPTTDAIQMLDGVMTVLVWMNCFGGTGEFQGVWVASAGGGLQGYGFFLDTRPGKNNIKLETYGSDNGRQPSTTSASPYFSKNIHAAAHFGRTSHVLDIDGVNRINETILDPGTVNTPADIVRVGRYTPSASVWPFWGMLYGIALFNRELSAAEKAHFQTHRPRGTEDGCVGYWPMDEGLGTIAHDLSSGANHGTIVGGLPWRQFAPIPALSDGTADALGNTLQYPGRAKYNVVPVQAGCATLAVNETIAITGITGATVLSQEGTAAVSIGTNLITCTTAGTLYNLKLTLADSKVLTIPFVESEGTAVYGYDDTGVVYTGTITAADIEVFWGGKQSTFFHGLEFGCNESSGTITPANPHTPGLDVLGNPLVYPPGRFNPSASYKLQGPEVFESLGANLGPELITNAADREFSSDTGWWSDTAGATIADGVCRIVSAGTNQGISRGSLMTVGKTYRLTYEIVQNLLGLGVKTDFGTGNLVSTVGSHSVDVVASIATFNISRSFGATDITIDNVSIREIYDTNASDFFDIDGASLAFTYANLLTYLGDQVFYSTTKGLAVYDGVQVDPALSKIKKALRIT